MAARAGLAALVLKDPLPDDDFIDPGDPDTYFLSPWAKLPGNAEQRLDHLDMIAGFVVGVDRISFEDVADVRSLDDLKIWRSDVDGWPTFVVKIKRTDERFLVQVANTGSWGDFIDARNFEFR